MKIAICDDECMDLTFTKKLIKEYDVSELLDVSTYTNSDDFLAACCKTHFDIALLDIEMAGTNGYEVATLLSAKDSHPLMIFVTKSMEYSIRGYGLVFRYLTKPVTLKSLSEVLDAAIREVTANSFSFAIDGGSHVIKNDDIYYFEVYNHSIILHAVDETFTIRSTLRDILSQLPQGYFGMPHQSYVVNLSHIKSSSATGIRLTNGAGIPVSRRKFKEFNRLLQMYLGR